MIERDFSARPLMQTEGSHANIRDQDGVSYWFAPSGTMARPWAANTLLPGLVQRLGRSGELSFMYSFSEHGVAELPITVSIKRGVPVQAN